MTYCITLRILINGKLIKSQQLDGHRVFVVFYDFISINPQEDVQTYWEICPWCSGLSRVVWNRKPTSRVWSVYPNYSSSIFSWNTLKCKLSINQLNMKRRSKIFKKKKEVLGTAICRHALLVMASGSLPCSLAELVEGKSAGTNSETTHSCVVTHKKNG